MELGYKGTVVEIKSNATFTSFKLRRENGRDFYGLVWSLYSEDTNIRPIQHAIRVSFLKESLINGKQITVDFEEGFCFVHRVAID